MSSAAPAVFDTIAPLYDRTRSVPEHVLEEMADRVFAIGGLGRGARVLDCGIGTGITVDPLLRRGARVFGVDVASEMLAILAGKARASGWPVHVARASAVAPPFRAASFDAAMMVNVAQLIPDWRTTAAELARVVRPKGHFVLVFRRPSAAESRLTQEYFARRRPSWAREIFRVSASTVRKLRSRVGRRHAGARWERALLGCATLVDHRTWTWEEEVATRDVLEWLDRRYLSYQSVVDDAAHARIVRELSASLAGRPETEHVTGKLVCSLYRFDREPGRRPS